MSYIKCTGAITESAQGYPQCSVPWESVPDSAIETVFEALTIIQAVEVSGAIMLLWAMAYGVRFIVKFIMSVGPGRFG